MGANTSNALFYLVSTLFEVYIWIVMLRMVLQVVRADFYNPISQLVWQVTQPVVRPLQKVFPKVRQYDTAAALVLFLVTLAYIFVASALLGYREQVSAPLAVWYTLLKLVTMLLN